MILESQLTCPMCGAKKVAQIATTRTFKLRHYPDYGKLAQDVSIPTTPDKLEKAVLSGGAPRRKATKK